MSIFIVFTAVAFQSVCGIHMEGGTLEDFVFGEERDGNILGLQEGDSEETARGKFIEFVSAICRPHGFDYVREQRSVNFQSSDSDIESRRKIFNEKLKASVPSHVYDRILQAVDQYGDHVDNCDGASQDEEIVFRLEDGDSKETAQQKFHEFVGVICGPYDFDFDREMQNILLQNPEFDLDSRRRALNTKMKESVPSHVYTRVEQAGVQCRDHLATLRQPGDDAAQVFTLEEGDSKETAQQKFHEFVAVICSPYDFDYVGEFQIIRDEHPHLDSASRNEILYEKMKKSVPSHVYARIAESSCLCSQHVRNLCPTGDGAKQNEDIVFRLEQGDSKETAKQKYHEFVSAICHPHGFDYVGERQNISLQHPEFDLDSKRKAGNTKMKESVPSHVYTRIEQARVQYADHVANLRQGDGATQVFRLEEGDSEETAQKKLNEFACAICRPYDFDYEGELQNIWNKHLHLDIASKQKIVHEKMQQSLPSHVYARFAESAGLCVRHIRNLCPTSDGARQAADIVFILEEGDSLETADQKFYEFASAICRPYGLDYVEEWQGVLFVYDYGECDKKLFQYDELDKLYLLEIFDAGVKKHVPAHVYRRIQEARAQYEVHCAYLIQRMEIARQAGQLVFKLEEGDSLGTAGDKWHEFVRAICRPYGFDYDRELQSVLEQNQHLDAASKTAEMRKKIEKSVPAHVWARILQADAEVRGLVTNLRLRQAVQSVFGSKEADGGEAADEKFQFSLPDGFDIDREWEKSQHLYHEFHSKRKIPQAKIEETVPSPVYDSESVSPSPSPTGSTGDALVAGKPGKNAKKNAAKRDKKKRKLAVQRIQAAVRGHTSRQACKGLPSQRIQAVLSGHATRREVGARLSQWHAAERIKGALKGCVSRLDVGRQARLNAARRIQSVLNGGQARREVRELYANRLIELDEEVQQLQARQGLYTDRLMEMADENMELQGLVDDLQQQLPQDTTCVVCLDQAKTHLFYPCGHKCVCAGCGANIMASNGACPICRVPAAGVVQVFE